MKEEKDEMFSKKDEETLLREKRQLQKAIKHNKKRTAVREWAMAKTIYSKGALKGKNQGNSR